MKKNIITRLRNISYFLNDEILDELGLSDLKRNTTLPGLEREEIELSSKAIFRYERDIIYSHLARGLACLEQGDFKRAFEDFKYLQGIPALNMEASEWAFFTGIANVGIGKFKKAIDNFKGFLEDWQKIPDVSFWLGVAYYEANNFDDAKRYFNSAINNDPYFEEAYLARGKAHIKNREWSKAEHDFFKALELNPENVEIQNNLALIRDINEKKQQLWTNLDEEQKA